VYKDDSYHSVTTPIYTTSTFAFEALGKTAGYDYSRSGNPTRSALEENIAALEGGAGCAATATGMAAVSSLLFLLSPGDHVVTGADIYGGTYRLFAEVMTRFGIAFSFIDMRDSAKVRAALNDRTKMIWIETPSNPLLHLVDIEATASIGGADILTVVDNTYLSPHFQRPLDLGADVVVHSTTKYLNGHSDVVGGAVIWRRPELGERIRFLVNALGVSEAPFDSWLVLRGVKTLPARMPLHERNATAVATFLEGHPNVRRVYYTGLPSHPQHQLALRQQRGHGGMLAFDMDVERVPIETFFGKLRLFHLAESLGGVESLIEHPWSMSHASMGPDGLAGSGLTRETVRVSVGIEDSQDLIDDLREALG
jgi:cystathionine beta-lyase/cystathionine gamma-synthase